MPETATKPRIARQTKRAVEKVGRSYFEAVARRDAAAMADHWHPEGLDDLVPVGILRGPDEVRRFFAELFAAFPDAETVVDRLTADTHVCAVQWRLTGTHTGAPFQGVQPAGRRVELRGCDCLEVEGGKIVRNTAYYDGAAVARGLGLLPARDSGGERAMIGAFNAVTRTRQAIADLRSRQGDR